MLEKLRVPGPQSPDVTPFLTLLVLFLISSNMHLALSLTPFLWNHSSKSVNYFWGDMKDAEIRSPL